MKLRWATVCLLGTLASSFLLVSQSASAAIPFCLPGSGVGQCKGPEGISIDSDTSHVYVADSGNKRVNVFEADGVFLNSLGTGQLKRPTQVAVDNNTTNLATRHDVYVGDEIVENVGIETVRSFELKRFGPSGEFLNSLGSQGTGPCQFESGGEQLAVGPGGVVYVSNRHKLAPNEFESRIERFEADGTCLDEVTLFTGNISVASLAVDSSGAMYVSIESGGGVIRKYDPSGKLIKEFGGVESENLALDSSGHLFAKQRGFTLTGQIGFFLAEYAPDGTLLRRFDYKVQPMRLVGGLAVSDPPSGPETIYLSEGASGVVTAAPEIGPIVISSPCQIKPGGLGSTKATVTAEVNPEGEETEYHVVYGVGSESVSSPAMSLANGAADFELHEASQTLTGLTPETPYHCKVVAESAGGSASGLESSFETKESFEFIHASVTDVGEAGATLDFEVNPLGSEATAHFEYVDDAKFAVDGFGEAQLAPASTLDLGDGEDPELVSTPLSALQPGTTYHWRLHVINTVHPDGFVCPRAATPPCPEDEFTFRTFGNQSGGDNRVWELVSPGMKNSAEVAVPGIAAGVHEAFNARIQASAGSGEAATYTSFTSFGKGQGAPSTSQYYSKRTPAGWVTENISPFGFQVPVTHIPYQGFLPELNLAAFKVTNGSNGPGCSDLQENLYLRSMSGSVTCLTAEEGHGRGGCYVFAGASEDGSRVFFASTKTFAGVPEGEGFSLYEWTAVEGIKPVSIFPGQSTPATPTGGTAFGPSIGPSEAGSCQFGHTIIKHAVSADGSKAFWTYRANSESSGDNPPTKLFARVGGTETIQLDAVPSEQQKEKPGVGPSGDGVFWAASRDGEQVYFTDAGKLIRGASADGTAADLYRYDFGSQEPLTDLTKGSVTANVLGVLGASDDGSYVYFVATGALTGEEENKAGERAQENTDNLYLWHSGTTRFVANLSNEDFRDWETQPVESSARVTPDGLHLAFLSVDATALSGYDNTVASGAHCEYNSIDKKLVGSPLCPQAYVYDAGSGSLSCASCNPAGSRPLGPTLVPGWTNSFEGPRIISNDGSRLFFESFDTLAAGDSNGLRDVYEFEPPGKGTCSNASANFDPRSGGCHFLVSSGVSSDESYLVDASSSGRDVFISTRQSLVPADVNENFDVYDFREGGGFPESPSPIPCASDEACKGPVGPVEPVPPLGTAQPHPAESLPQPKKPKHKKHKKHHRKHSATKNRPARGHEGKK